MEINDREIDMTKLLSILKNEEELIIKPFQSGKIIKLLFNILCFIIQGFVHEIGAVECGKIVSRVNKALFDYQIGIR